MNLSQKYQVERIIINVVTTNKDKTLNELKRLVKAKIEEQISLKIASEIGIEEIIEIITQNKLLKEDNEDKTTTKKCKSTNKIKEEMER